MAGARELAVLCLWFAGYLAYQGCLSEVWCWEGGECGEGMVGKGSFQGSTTGEGGRPGICRTDESEGGREDSDGCPRAGSLACTDKEEHLKPGQELQEERGTYQGGQAAVTPAKEDKPAEEKVPAFGPAGSPAATLTCPARQCNGRLAWFSGS